MTLPGPAFVTGGSGFVGRALIDALVARGVAVRALARSDRAEATVRAHGAEPVRGDLEDGLALRRGTAGASAVFHAGAYVDDWGPADAFRRINVVATERLLETARDQGVTRFIHVGTEAVFVDGSPTVNMDESRPLPERPVGPYPRTKNLAERAVRAADGDGFTTVVVRPRLVWGNGDTSVLPRIVEAVDQGVFRWIAGGEYLTSTCHVRNLAHASILAAERGRGGAAYFVTDGSPVTFRYIVTEMLRAVGKDPGERRIPRWALRAVAAGLEAAYTVMPFLPGRPPVTRSAVLLGGVEVTVNDARARRELGYANVVSMAAGLAEMRAAGPAAMTADAPRASASAVVA